MIEIEVLEESIALDLETEIQNDELEVEFEEVFEKEGAGTYDYEKLKNLPALDEVTIKGNVREKDPTVPGWAKNETKPSYTAAETGSVPDDGGISLEEIASWFERRRK